MPKSDPHDSLRESMATLLGEQCSDQLLGDLPKRWERFDDVVLLPAGAGARADHSGYASRRS